MPMMSNFLSRWRRRSLVNESSDEVKKNILQTIGTALSGAGLQSKNGGEGGSIPVVKFRWQPPLGKQTRAARTTLEPSPSWAQFLTCSFSNEYGTLNYKLYVPKNIESRAARAVSMIVMLHGCTQSADDFAAGTRMNALANRDGFLVLYPEQAVKANSSKCWSWFNPGDQGRDAGEPSLIAGMTRFVAAEHALDFRHVFVAGLSAGGAMAVILGQTYPELYAAIGVHSGLPYAAAHDIGSAFAAMRGSSPRVHSASHAQNSSECAVFVPTIVFHGDGDKTVAACNGRAIADQAMQRYPGSASSQVQYEASVGDCMCNIVQLQDRIGKPVVELWLVEGAPHAWCGGSPAGSYTQAKGPDASGEMLRFFSERTHIN